jgi:hypothetical protein
MSSQDPFAPTDDAERLNVAQGFANSVCRISGELTSALREPHSESFELAETGFTSWATGLGEDASDLVAPGAGEEVRWSAERGWEVSKR